MDNPPPPPPPPTHLDSSTNNNNRDHFLRHLTHLNKHSHKISKPTNRPPEPPLHPQPPPQNQPPVYNISKSDFRDVVQKLTGSPSHASPLPTLHAPKPNSSRLQRIRPPPLAPPPSGTTSTSVFGPGLGQMSPLPPLPTCHSAAESPISAYMRFLNNNTSGMIMFPPPENFENIPPAEQPSFGCSPSPKSLLSPKLLLPLSPTVSSPK